MVRLVLLIRRQMKTLEVIGDSARPEVMALPQVQDLAHDLAWSSPRRSMRRPRPIGQACLPELVKPALPFVERRPRDAEIPAVCATWQGSSPAARKIFKRHAVGRVCSAFVIALSLQVVAPRKELNVSPFYWDFTAARRVDALGMTRSVRH